ncbi:Uncharacterised protein [Escherichia coli]|uniref:Uncharacterized protein n=1 Tax=Escherichia coli TaxID=562 RepID=A0A2X1JAP1_ECOLX|nr:Uncharacterised protein [Escherichia coli]
MFGYRSNVPKSALNHRPTGRASGGMIVMPGVLRIITQRIAISSSPGSQCATKATVIHQAGRPGWG